MPVPKDKLRLGGMALRNGLLVHGPTHWAAAVRTKQGDIKVASGPKPRIRFADDVPGVRGLVRLAEAFAVIPLVKKGLPEAKMAFEQPSVLGVAAGASIAGTLLRRRAPGATGELASALRRARARAVRAARRRAGRLPRRRAQGDRRLRGRRRRRARRAQGARALRLAPDGADAGGQRGGHAAAQARGRAPDPIMGGAVSLASTAAAVEVFAWTERHADSPLTQARSRCPATSCSG